MKPPTFGARVRAAVKGWVQGTEGYSPWHWDATGLISPSVGSAIDWRAEAGPPDGNAVVVACLNWVVTTFPEAPPQVQRRTGDKLVVVPDHALIQLLDMPNAYYTGLDLWAATLFDYNLCGNAYWLAPLNAAGRAVELWYEPHFSIRPVGSATAFIDHWEIYRGGTWQALRPREVAVVHYRRGIDPRNPRQGLSPLLTAARELYTDNQAAYWAATLLRNTGVPGVVIAPKDGGTIANIGSVKQAYQANFTGDGRGGAMVLSEPADVFKVSWSPAEMDLTALRRLPEERISALLGVPAIVAGLGAGLDRSTYANYAAARAQGWDDNISPTQRRFAATLQADLLPLLGNPATERVSFDTSQVQALQEDADALYTRMATGYNAGFVKRSEARQATGWPVDPGGADDVYKMPPPLQAALARTTGQDPGDQPPSKALPAGPTKAAPRPDPTEGRFRADVQAVLDTLYREALAEVPEGKALALRNGAHDGD